MKRNTLSPKQAERYRALARQLHNLPLIAQGNVFAIEPSNDAPRAQTHYKWTRKIKAKTVSETLSREQYQALDAAIKANRHLEETLRQMRELSQDAILENLPESPGKRRRKPS